MYCYFPLICSLLIKTTCHLSNTTLIMSDLYRQLQRFFTSPNDPINISHQVQSQATCIDIHSKTLADINKVVALLNSVQCISFIIPLISSFEQTFLSLLKDGNFTVIYRTNLFLKGRPEQILSCGFPWENDSPVVKNHS